MNHDKHIELYCKYTNKVNLNRLNLDYTTPEQSKRLVELGIPIKSANIVYYHTPDSWYDPYLITENGHIENLKLEKGLPCWSAGRLIEIHLKCCTTLNQNDIYVVISRFGIETGGLLQNMYDIMCECALLGKYDFSKLKE